MMRQTAAIQVNVDLGADDATPSRWQTAHALGPAARGGLRELAVRRERAVGMVLDPAGGVAGDRARSVGAGRLRRQRRVGVGRLLDACAGDVHPRVRGRLRARCCEPLSFADWITGGHELGWPTEDDLAYHLTTLFPPIRPRGWLELRMVDSLPSEWSIVPAHRRRRAARGRGSREAHRAGRSHRSPGRWDDAARDSRPPPRLRAGRARVLRGRARRTPAPRRHRGRHRRGRALPRPVRARATAVRPTT